MEISLTVPYKLPSLNKSLSQHWGAASREKNTLLMAIMLADWVKQGDTAADNRKIAEISTFLLINGYNLPPIPKKKIDGVEIPDAIRDPIVAQIMAERAYYKLRPRQKVRLYLTAYLPRVLDTDNLNFKYVIDALRYAGLIWEDTPEFCELHRTQEKCAKGEAPSVSIKLEYIV
jgi:hypothetical protein